MSLSISSPTYEKYKSELRRIAWRMQYRSRTRINRELPLLYDVSYSLPFTDETDSRLWIQQLIQSLPEGMEQQVMTALFVRDLTEKQVAAHYHISQQAVSKWKKKALQTICRKMQSAN
ncbi:sigma factor-like helix-turn-helix DNA-binding protein [Paenibacillus sp. WLX2291]|uniref:sigma factor-like helix-turn-helix DNA-binding protein n=1 Tax=Paenibacillus sp. WLX2291 TaxID=3296934 RepID=UPI00398421AE